MIEPKINEHEKDLIIIGRCTAGWDWDRIAEELNHRFEAYNERTRTGEQVREFLTEYRKTRRLQFASELRLQGFPEEDIVEKLNEVY